MSKKLILVLAALLVLGSGSIFALGIGAQGGFTPGDSGVSGGAITFKLDTPWVFAANATFGNYTAFGLTADMWLGNPKISGTFGYFYGVGLAGSLATTNNWSSIFIGARAFVGLNIYIVKQLEFYLIGAWQPGFSFNVSGDGGQAGLNLSSFPMNIGFRFWF